MANSGSQERCLVQRVVKSERTVWIVEQYNDESCLFECKANYTGALVGLEQMAVSVSLWLSDT